MADDVLSQAERELLASRMPATARPRPAAIDPHERGRRAIAAAPTTIPMDRVEPHDFKRPRSVDDEQLRVLSMLHERVARGFAAALSIAVRCPARVKLAIVDQPTYAQWLRGLENPTCLSVLRAAPLSGELALDVGLPILFPILDRMLGGGREPGPTVRRPLTTIELRLASRIQQLFLVELAKAWRDVAELVLSVQRVESDPHAARIVLPGEGVVRANFEVSMGTVRGTMSLCLPATALRSVAHHLLAPAQAGKCPAATGETVAQLSRQVSQTNVTVVARLAATRVPTADLLELRVGDLIVTHQGAHQPLEISVENTPKFLARAGALQGRKAVQIEAALDAPPEPAAP
ncbi:MAG: FliM/FliN family flagellar motor switch protein [Pirellulales bacterium]